MLCNYSNFSHSIGCLCICCVWFFTTLWTAAHQTPLSMVLSRQEYCNGLLCCPPGESSQSREQTHVFYTAGRFFTSESQGKPKIGDIMEFKVMRLPSQPFPNLRKYIPKEIHHSVIINLDVNAQRPRNLDIHQYTMAQQPRCPSTDEQIRKGVVHCVQWNITQPLKRTN